MDLKKEAALLACTYINDHSSIGLGDGSTVRMLGTFLIERINNGLDVRVYTSSLSTLDFLKAAGVIVNDISTAENMDLYFDGCDQVDHQLNALKSGSGIHTMEKLFASMARRFIIMADAPKYVAKLDRRYPLVLEVLPQAISHVRREMQTLYPDSNLTVRKSHEDVNKQALTRNGNLLLDCWFAVWPEAARVQHESKNITGVVEISLFHKLVDEAIIAGNDGVLKYT